MLTDIDKEFDTPILDENGEPIEVIEIEEAFGDVNHQEPIEQENYEGVEGDVVQEDVEEEQVNILEEVIVEAKENYENVKEQLVSIFTTILENGEITAEDNVTIQQVKEQYSQAYNTVKENTEVVQRKTLEQRIEELSDGMVGASVDDILNILTEGGTKCWLYKDDDGNVLIDMTAIPLVTAVFNKLFLISTDGEEESSIQLTPEMIDLISTTITLTAERINLNGYISNDEGNFAIDQQGNMDVQDLNVKGEFSCESLTVTSINNPKYAETLEGSVSLLVNASTGSDDAALEQYATFKSIKGALSKLPKDLGGKTVNITLRSDVTENVLIENFYNGRIRIYFEGHTVFGTYKENRVYAQILVYGGSISNLNGSIGKIMPNIGIDHSGYSTSVSNLSSPDTYMYSIKIYAATNLASGTSESAAVCVGTNGFKYLDYMDTVNCNYGFRANTCGTIYVGESKGKATKYGFVAVSGGNIKLGNDIQVGGEASNTYESSGGIIKYHNATFTTTGSTGDNTSPAPTPTPQTITFTSNSGDTYRGTYSSWRNDGTVIQGNAYGSGTCRGYWFFGNQFAELVGCNISKIVLKIKRTKIGSWGSAVNYKLGYHAYTSKPTTPSTYPTVFQTVSISAYSGEYVSITITNSTVLDGIKNGTIKGFGLYDSTYSASLYAGASGTAKATFTYTEG